MTTQGDIDPMAAAWTQQGGVVGLGSLFPGGRGESRAFAASANGSSIVGYSVVPPPSVFGAFRYVSGLGIQALPAYYVDPATGFSYSAAYGVSADGNVVVGEASGSNGLPTPVRWVLGEFEAVHGLYPAGLEGAARAVSAEGDVVVGHAYPLVGGTQAFVWTPDRGFRTVQDELKAQGLSLTPDTYLSGATGVTVWMNTVTVVGYGDNNNGHDGWVARFRRFIDSD